MSLCVLSKEQWLNGCLTEKKKLTRKKNNCFDEKSFCQQITLQWSVSKGHSWTPH